MKNFFTPEHYYPYIGGVAQVFTPVIEVLLSRKYSVIVIPFGSEDFRFAASKSMALVDSIISSQQGAWNEVVFGRCMAMDAVASTALSEALMARGSEKKLKQFPYERNVKQCLEMYKSL